MGNFEVISNGTFSHVTTQYINAAVCAKSKCIEDSAESRIAAMDDGSKPYYVTTPIFYVNAAPHVGHMYSMVLADVMKRWQVLKGRKAILCTGTDEHGLKIQQAAAKAKSEPKSFCDKGADIFKTLADRVGISNDHFVRTTDPAHRDAVEYAWHLLENRGYIYQSKHEGWYSISDEAFYPESAVQLHLDPPTGRKIMISTETGKEVQWSSEINYRFRLSAFRQRLLDFYEANPIWITPANRMNDIVVSVQAGLEDLSISRPLERLSWGIRVPSDDSQTIYVWLDALLNYATKAGYPWAPGAEHQGGWPADVHIIGKDIMRFHCVYWPAFLMALDQPLPVRIMTHAHWQLGKQKMAKSTGNVVNPFFAIDRFGKDTMRFFLMHNGRADDDMDYDNRYVTERYLKDLKGGLGNLAGRVMSTKRQSWNVEEAVRRYENLDDLAKDCDEKPQLSKETLSRINGLHKTNHNAALYYKSLQQLRNIVDQHFEALEPNKALVKMTEHIYATNAFMQAQQPWTLVQEMGREDLDPAVRDPLQRRVDRTIYLTAEAVRILAILLQPYIPDKAGMLLNMLGVHPEKRTWSDAQVGADHDYGKPREGVAIDDHLFPRLPTAD